LNGELVNQIHYQVDPELVSSDIIGDTCCSVFDSNATIVSPDGKSVVLYAWYDNEFGYTKQVIRLAKHSKVHSTPIAVAMTGAKSERPARSTKRPGRSLWKGLCLP
jgi:hypothetical protein